jgi:two-component system, LytTR family, response regulator
MRRIRTLLIEDESAALSTLRGMLMEFCPEVEIVGESTSVSSAIQQAAELKPELVFLDIEMPPLGNGFDFIRLSKYKDFRVIFSTAYPQYAVKAINEILPLAYLIKPFSVADLADAVQTAVQSIIAPPVKPLIETEGRGFIVHDMRKGNIVIRYNELLYCEADRSVTHLYCQRAASTNGTERITATGNIGNFEMEFPKHIFVRVHNSFIVNLLHIARYESLTRTALIYLSDGSSVPVSAQKLEGFKQTFEAHIKGR